MVISFFQRMLGLLAFALFLSVATLAQAQDQSEHQATKMSSSEYLQKLQYAQLYEQQRDPTNAMRIYGELYTVNPNDVSVFEGYVRSLIALKKYDDAEHVVNQRMKVDNSLETLLLSARLEAWLNKRPEALAAFQKAELHANAHDCAALFPIVYAMMDVSYNQDALQLLDQMRKNSSGDADICSSQIAGLYLRLGQFDRASSQFIQILKSGEGNVGMVEQRLAEYLTDSLSRETVLSSLEKAVLAYDSNPANGGVTRANLRLLAWLYEERKDYTKALATIVQIDDMHHAENENEGPELLQFADRARSEGALEAAAKAYTEASRRMNTNHVQGYYASSAQLGSLKTWEAYYLASSAPKDSIAALVSQYETFAASEKVNELSLDALLHAANLSYSPLFDLPRATKDYEALSLRDHSMNDAMRDALFRLVDIAFADQDFPLAESRMQHIDDILSRIRGLDDKEIRNHLLYDRALEQYYRQNFDSASVLLQDVASDAASDYANDAIQLSGIIESANAPGSVASLKRFATASLLDQAHQYAQAEADYRSMIDTQFNSPLADRAALRSAQTLVALGRPNDAVRELDSMQSRMISSPLLDVAAFQEAEIVDKNLHDKARAQKMYEDFLERYPNSDLLIDARERARKLRGDAF
ncbi:MAG TPA: hypothetical protein VGM92_00325 [Candidatus Kapabacteria bacterium]|jgi:TolA-binding protein